MKRIVTIIVFCLLLINCSAKLSTLPEADLKNLNRIGVVTFTVINARGVLDEIATEILIDHLKNYFKESKIILLGKPADLVNDEFGFESSPKTLINICKKNELDAFFYGKITISDLIAKIKVKSLLQRSRISAKFRMKGELNLYSESSEKIIWSGSAFKNGNASYDHYAKDLNPDFYVSDKDESYRKFVRKLIYSLTEDLRPSK